MIASLQIPTIISAKIAIKAINSGAFENLINLTPNQSKGHIIINHINDLNTKLEFGKVRGFFKNYNLEIFS